VNTPDWPAGLVALHGNQTEVLADTVLAWLGARPLGVLEPEVVLVQSSGMAEWFKMRMAQRLGVCAAARVELPARFIWRSYRQILGAHAVPLHAPLDKTPMTWRLMRLLPQCLHHAACAALARFLQPAQPGQALRLLQLAQRLADLFDQYQNHRSDWLAAWAQGRDVLPNSLFGAAHAARPVPVPPEQLWQPLLWRVLLEDLGAEQRQNTRAHLHTRARDALQSGAAPAAPLARRVTVFGISQMPQHVLEFLAALARHSQVLIAVHNPCRFHWADALSGRELLRMAQRRQPLRGGRDLAQIALEDMHVHAHPLLAAWGRQSRDHVRQLDAFDNPQDNALHAQWPRVDLFEETDADALRAAPLLAQVQQRVRDMVPLAEHPPLEVAQSDRSIVFHSAHSLLRELEVLHDALLDLLTTPAAAGQAPLQPYDIVVMLPAIEPAAAAIRAVFGQYPRHDPRHIPFDIADLGARARSSLVAALQWLLRLPQQRCHSSELCDLLQVPAIAVRLGLLEADLPLLARWMAGSGIRWGLHAAQRAALGLEACGEQGSAWFGLQRMLLGYASGALPEEVPGFAGIEPYDAVGGLSAELAGVLAALVERLLAWWELGRQSLPPDEWARHFRALLDDFFSPQGAQDEAALAALHSALQVWQNACAQAGFAAPLPLDAAQHGWLAALDLPALNQRFRAGGVTFCTLMPMRAIPFEVVCLLGMNEGDYPRRAPRSDWDLMALKGQPRPGDRARRDDDRQLMLEAVLSARRALHISWSGQSVRDNSAQPPSVLVAQLRDYLAAGWCGEGTQAMPRAARGAHLLAQRTQQHPLQPFSRRYFEQGAPLHTWAREWRSVHSAGDDAPAPPHSAPPPPVSSFAAPFTASLAAPESAREANLEQIARFLRDPARFYLRQHLQMRFELEDSAPEDAEMFDLAALDAYRLVQHVQQAVSGALLAAHAPACAPDIACRVQRQVQRLLRAGQLPLAAPGEHAAHLLAASCTRTLQAWWEQICAFPHPHAPRHVHLAHQDLLLQDWLDGVRGQQPDSGDSTGIHTPITCAIWLQAGNMCDKSGALRPHKLLDAYLHSLALAAGGSQALVCVAAPDCLLHASAPEPQAAREQLRTLLQLWHSGQSSPVPLPLKEALLMAADQGRRAADSYTGGSYRQNGTGQQLPWARLYPDFDSLCADGRFADLSRRTYAPLLDWMQHHVTLQSLGAAA